MRYITNRTVPEKYFCEKSYIPSYLLDILYHQVFVRYLTTRTVLVVAAMKDWIGQIPLGNELAEQEEISELYIDLVPCLSPRLVSK